MTTQTFKITNVSGADHRTVGGLYADGESKDISIVDLIVNPQNLVILEDDLSTGGLITVEYNGTNILAAEIELVMDIIASHAQPQTAPKLDMLDVVGGAAVAAAGGNIELVGRNLKRGQLFDSLQLTEGAADFTIYALKPGVSDITVELIQGGGAAGLTYNPGTKACVIDIGAAGSPDDALATLVNAVGSQCEGILRANSIGGGNFTAPQAEAPLTGGLGNYDGNKVMVGGLEALPISEAGATSTPKWTDTGLSVTTQAVGVATDVVNIEVEVDGLLVPSLSAVLV
jgi:hypothetical protein